MATYTLVVKTFRTIFSGVKTCVRSVALYKSIPIFFSGAFDADTAKWWIHLNSRFNEILF